MKRTFITLMIAAVCAGPSMAVDHVIAAAKPAAEKQTPAVLSLSLNEAQDYAVESNRSLKNASLAVQEAYAQRWQTIASMLPNVDLSWSYTNMCGYKMEMNFGTMKQEINMPNSSSLSIQTSMGVNGQAIVGALLNNVALRMKKISYEQSAKELRASVMESYVSVLTLQSITDLLDESLNNLRKMADMTQRTVEVGAAEQTTADQIKVRVNAQANMINQQKRSIVLATNALKVLLDVPVTTELNLTSTLEEVLSPEAVLKSLGKEFDINDNYNYQLLKESTELARLNVAMAGVAYGPTLAAFHQYSNQHYYAEGGFRMTPPNTVGLSVSMPLWSSGKREAGVIEKKIAYEEAKNTLSETVDNLAIQDQQLRFNLQNAYETYVNEKDNISVTKRVFESTTHKFNMGAGSNLDLINASNDLISAQSSYVQAVLNLVNAQVILETFLNK